MASPPHFPANLQSILREILRSQQLYLHTMSACADELSILSTSLTPSALTHTGTAFPRISQITHHQQLITNTLPWFSLSSFHQQPAFINSTNLCHHHIYQDPTPPSELLLNTDSTSLPLVPTVKRETVKTHELLVPGINFSSITNFFVPEAEERSEVLVAEAAVKSQKFVADLVSDVVEEQKVHVTKVFETLDPPTPVPDRFVPAANEREEPLQYPPSMFQMPSQVASFPKTWAAPPPQVDAVSTVNISGSKLCFAFIFLTPDPPCSPCFEFDMFALATTGVSPEKTVGNINFVFDSGRISPCYEFSLSATVTVFVFETDKMAMNTISATPPDRSTFVFDPGGNSTITGAVTSSFFQHHCCVATLCGSDFGPRARVPPQCIWVHLNLESQWASVILFFVLAHWITSVSLGFSLLLHCKWLGPNGLLTWVSKKNTLGHWIAFHNSWPKYIT